MGFVANKIYGSIIYSSNNNLLLVQGRETGKWSFPKGHRKEDEAAFQCAFRETMEETGLEIDNNYLEELTLAAGKYYVYKLEHEPVLRTIDCNEIMNIAWVPLTKLHGYIYNCDVRSYIMNEHNLRHNKIYLGCAYNLEEGGCENMKKIRKVVKNKGSGSCKKMHCLPPEWESYSRFVDYI